MSDKRFPRRVVFHGLGALGAAVALASCGDDDGDGGTTSSDNSDTPSNTPSDPPTSKSPHGGGGAKLLATTDEVPVAGGLIISEERVVITQPTAGEFVAFSATCTHQGCIVSSVGDGRISCGCHGSVYDAATGENIGGPAPAPLGDFKIMVKGDEIFAA